MENTQSARCFKCEKQYPSNDQDDLAGDGKCPSCKKLSVDAARIIDAEFARRPKNHQSKYSQIINAPEGTRINARDLGITFGS